MTGCVYVRMERIVSGSNGVIHSSLQSMKRDATIVLVQLVFPWFHRQQISAETIKPVSERTRSVTK